MKAPVLVFTYNRVHHTKETIRCLQQNELAADTELFLFSDGPATPSASDAVQEVRDYLKTITGFKNIRIIEREKNVGLGNNIIDGVSTVLGKYEKVIVLEDDLKTSPFFLKYMNDALDLYARDEQVISVHGYVYPVKATLPETFFLKGADCWGWGTWKRGWDLFEKNGQVLLERLEAGEKTREFDFNGAYPYTEMLRSQIAGKNSSWAVRWYASAFLENRFTLYPGRSLVFHNGGDGTGTNSGFESELDVVLTDTPVSVDRIKVEQNTQAYSAFEKFLRKLARPDLLYRLKRRWKKINMSRRTKK